MITFFLLRVNHRRSAQNTGAILLIVTMEQSELLECLLYPDYFSTGSLKRFIVVIPSLDQFTPVNPLQIPVVNKSKLGCTQLRFNLSKV